MEELSNPPRPWRRSLGHDHRTTLQSRSYPYQDDVLALPVEDLDQASQWYANALGLTEVERRDDPVPTVIMQRDGVQIGFAINGGDASNDGAAILVTDIERARRELEASGLSPSANRASTTTAAKT